MNIENFKLVLNYIKANPEEWNQINSAHSFLGWAQILSGKEQNYDTVRKDARLFLRITAPETDYILEAGRTIDNLS